MIHHNQSLTEEEKAVLQILETTPEKTEKRNQALEAEKKYLPTWMAKPLSNFRYQTPDEQFENNSTEMIVPVENQGIN